MSKFLPSLTAAGAMKRLGIPAGGLEKELPAMVTAGIHRLYAFQHDDGGWGWWCDDKTNDEMTAYVMYGLVTAQKAGFDVDKGVIEKGLEALRGMTRTGLGLHVRKLAGEEVALDLTPESDEDRAWLVLAGRPELAKEFGLEFKKGALEVRRLAMVLRAIASVDGKDARVGPLVEKLLEARQGGAWYSTIDSAYAVYALAEVASAEKEPAISVKVGGKGLPMAGGRCRLKPPKPGPVEIEVTAEGGTAFASAVLSWWSAEEGVAARAGAFEIKRAFQRSLGWKDGERVWEDLKSGAEVTSKDELRVVLVVTAKERADYVMIESPIPAGTEARGSEAENYDWWASWYDRRELHDDKVAVAASHLGAEYEHRFEFRLRVTLPGTYHVMPAVAWGMYETEKRGAGGEFVLRVRE